MHLIGLTEVDHEIRRFVNRGVAFACRADDCGGLRAAWWSLRERLKTVFQQKIKA